MRELFQIFVCWFENVAAEKSVPSKPVVINRWMSDLVRILVCLHTSFAPWRSINFVTDETKRKKKITHQIHCGWKINARYSVSLEWLVLFGCRAMLLTLFALRLSFVWYALACSLAGMFVHWRMAYRRRNHLELLRFFFFFMRTA